MLSGWNASDSMHFTLTARHNLETSRSFLQPEAAVSPASLGKNISINNKYQNTKFARKWGRT